MSPNSQDFGPVTSTNISLQPPPITAGDIATGQFAINMLLDDVLLEIFACYVEESEMRDAWHTLACVCRRWRSIAFGSPRRLNLRIFCSDRKRIPVRKNLDLWPPFPIVLTAEYGELGGGNLVAALEHHDRVCHIEIWNMSSSVWEKTLSLMQKPFPILTDLHLWYADEMSVASVVPDLFLGGSATQLRKLNFSRIPFPGLPKLILSATHLVHLELYDIPDSGYISPEVMVTCLSTLTRLESLLLSFESPLPRPEWERRRTSSPTRTLLPSLTRFTFKGVSEYLEDMVDRIDAPQLVILRISFFHQPIFDAPQLVQFISRVPKLKTCNEARLRIDSWCASFKAAQVLSFSKTTTNAYLLLEDWHRQPDSQLSALVQLCTSSFPQVLIPTVECLAIVGSDFSRPPIDPSLWRELLQPFTAVKDLYLDTVITPHIARTLQELVGENVLQLLPVLQNIFLEDRQAWLSRAIPEGIEQFVSTRQLASHPISVSGWEIDSEEGLTW